MDVMKRPAVKLVITALILFFGTFPGVSYAADPVPSTTPQNAAIPEATTSTVTVVPVVPAPAPAPASDTISIDFKDADINSVLRVLSMKSNVNIVTGPEVKGLVTVRLDNVPWEKALDVILRTYNYVFERDGNIIRVTTRDQMKLEPVETKTFILNYSKAKEIQASITDMLSERGKVKVSERSNMLVVTDVPTNLYRIGEVIKKLDKVTEQAFIDSKVVRTEAGVAENLGIKWNPQVSVTGSSRPITAPFTSADGGTPMSLRQFFPNADALSANPKDPRAFPDINPLAGTSGASDAPPQFNYGTLDFSSFSATLQMLKSYTNSKVVSNPRVVVLNNQTAKIQVGSDYPIPNFERNETTGSMEVSGYNYRELGVVLNVTPHINSAQEILVDLNPEISSFGSMVTFISGTGGLAAPQFNVTKAKTQVLIESGQTIAIGGLMSDSVGSSEDKVPYLADIPLVGKLFRSKRQTAGDPNNKIETLFFVTVTTVDSQGQPAGDKVDGKKDQSKDDQAPTKPAATDAAPGLKDSEKPVVSDNTNKDKPA
jgi:type IV pilus assembly protein PilQ